jgi:EAL domain-containing protein (putative c-di-GMP-specific phosphodiesterase class I)
MRPGQLGCDLGQGFLYARAAPADALTVRLSAPQEDRIAS